MLMKYMSNLWLRKLVLHIRYNSADKSKVSNAKFTSEVRATVHNYLLRSCFCYLLSMHELLRNYIQTPLRQSKDHQPPNINEAFQDTHHCESEYGV
jgi:hypothetical protein